MPLLLPIRGSIVARPDSLSFRFHFSQPKGVMVAHCNLISNSALITQLFREGDNGNTRLSKCRVSCSRFLAIKLVDLLLIVVAGSKNYYSFLEAMCVR